MKTRLAVLALVLAGLGLTGCNLPTATYKPVECSVTASVGADVHCTEPAMTNSRNGN